MPHQLHRNFDCLIGVNPRWRTSPSLHFIHRTRSPVGVMGKPTDLPVIARSVAGASLSITRTSEGLLMASWAYCSGCSVAKLAVGWVWSYRLLAEKFHNCPRITSLRKESNLELPLYRHGIAKLDVGILVWPRYLVCSTDSMRLRVVSTCFRWMSIPMNFLCWLRAATAHVPPPQSSPTPCHRAW